jgi:hypothetical protein
MKIPPKDIEKFDLAQGNFLVACGDYLNALFYGTEDEIKDARDRMDEAERNKFEAVGKK